MAIEKREEQPIVTPIDADSVLEMIQAFEYFKSKVLTTRDFATIQGKPFVKKSGWSKYALACNVSTELREERVEEREGKRIYHFTYRAVHLPTGRFADAVGSCSETEREKWDRPEHDPRSKAQTRAYNRCISNLVGGGEVSAEEMRVGQGSPSPEETPAPFIDQAGILDVLEKAGLDTTVLVIYPDDGRYVVKPQKFLGNVWARYNDALVSMGFRWIRAGKEWEVRVREEG